MNLLVFFSINLKTPQEKERLKSSVNWGKILINNLRILVRVLFGSIACKTFDFTDMFFLPSSLV